MAGVNVLLGEMLNYSTMHVVGEVALCEIALGEIIDGEISYVCTYIIPNRTHGLLIERMAPNKKTNFFKQKWVQSLQRRVQPVHEAHLSGLQPRAAGEIRPDEVTEFFIVINIVL
jgi:hypothetical protein